MDLEQFLRAVLPTAENGNYFTASVRKGGKFKQIRCSSISELMDKIDKMKQCMENVYLAIGQFEEGAESREGKHATFKRAFYADLDCGEGKPYTTKADAATALVKFCADTGFPRPAIVVDSGRGIHAYWTLTEDIRKDVWVQAAETFRDYMLKSGLQIDAPVTADVARIMRVPTSQNYKDYDEGTGEAKPCNVVKHSPGNALSFAEFIKCLPDESVLDNVVSIDGAPVDNSALESFDTSGRYVTQIRKECAALNTQIEERGANAGYQTWFLTLLLLKYCEDGHEWTEAVSDGHPEYTPEILRRKLDAIDSIELGAPKCETFARECGECKSCPHWDDEKGETTGKFKSPIAFGRLPQEIDLYCSMPFPFVRNKGKTYTLKRDGDDWKEVFAFDGTIPEIRIFGNTDEPTIEYDYDCGDHERQKVRVPVERALRGDALNKVLVNTNDVIMMPEELPPLGRLIMAWYKQAKAVRKTIPAVMQYGWVHDENRIGFAVGNYVAWDDGETDEDAYGADSETAKMYKARGSVDHWKNHVRNALQAEHIETEVLIAASFAAPLVALSSERGCVLSAFSPESGTGKSLGLRLGQAVWGHPVQAILSLDDTHNATVGRVSITNNLPAYWDEVRLPNDKMTASFTELIYRLTLGKEKSRLEQTSELRKVRSWEAMVICTSNTSLYDVLKDSDRSSNAGHLRVLEFQVSPLDRSKMANAHSFTGLDNNYGMVGREYAKFLSTRKEVLTGHLSKMIEDITNKWGCSTDERFQVVAAATTIMGAQLAKHMGLANFNVPAIRDFLRQAIERSRAGDEKSVQTSTRNDRTTDIVKAYMSDMAKQSMVTRTMLKGKGPVLDHPREEPVLVRVSVASGDSYIRLAKAPFTKWVQRNFSNSTHHISMLEGMGAEVKNARMFSNVVGYESKTNPVQRCLNIPLTNETEHLFPESASTGELPDEDVSEANNDLM